MSIAVFLSVLLFAKECLASNNGEYYSYFLKTLGSLLIILSIIFIVIYFLKKMNVIPKLKSGRIKVIDKLYMDSKHYIAIVEIDGSLYALGVAENINLITKIENSNQDKNEIL